MTNEPIKPSAFTARPITPQPANPLPCERDQCLRHATWQITYINPDTKPINRFPCTFTNCTKHAAAWILEQIMNHHPKQPTEKCEPYPRLSGSTSESSQTET